MSKITDGMHTTVESTRERCGDGIGSANGKVISHFVIIPTPRAISFDDKLGKVTRRLYQVWIYCSTCT